MTKSLSKFKTNISSSSVLERIFEYLDSKTLPFEPDELLRAEFVMVVSAFDCYIHDYVREKLLDIFKEPSAMTDRTKEYKISFGAMMDIINESNPVTQIYLLEKEIKDIESKNTYQSSRNVEKALGLIGFRKIWSKIYGDADAKTNKDQLDLIVRRRNQIAHEADMDFVTNKKNPIVLEDVLEAKKFLCELANKIDDLT